MVTKRLPFPRRIWLYIRHDLREIVAPSSIPNPPEYIPPPRLPLKDWVKVFVEGTRLYTDTWDSKKVEQHLTEHYGEEYAKERVEKETARQEWQDLASGFATAAKGGVKTVVPYLQSLYTSRAGAYGEALKQFVTGYREGLQEGMQKPMADELKDKQ